MKKPIQILSRWSVFLLFFWLWTSTAGAQTTDPALMQQARSEIQRRGLDETEVRVRLLQHGIDMDRVTPEQLPSLQDTILQVISELEAEKAKSVETISTDKAKDIQQKVKEGASVEEAISEELTRDQAPPPPALIWGQHLFRDKSLSIFRTTNDVKPPDSYILSSGDVITISIFGASQFDSQFEINKEGYVQPTGMPKIFLKGVPLGQAKALLRSRFSQFYRFTPEQFAASLTTARSITINIFGETVNYGSFSLSAINTAFNALAAAGGPTDLGSVRNIKVMRGRDSKRLDIYAFMSNPAVQYDFFLEDNDIIYVPVAERVVGISGAVGRPFRYELTGNENLNKLLEFAGGFKANAYQELIQVQRYVDDKRVLIDVNLKYLLAQKQDFALLNGDEVFVRTIPPPIGNTVTISGAVEFPGEYALSETKRISDLLKRGVLRPVAREDAAFLLRTNVDNTTRLIQLNVGEILAAPGSGEDILLQPKDLLTIYTQGRYTDQGTINISGAVRDAITDYPYTHDSSLTLQRAILLAGGLRPDASGMGLIIRNKPNNTHELEYVEVDLAAAFDHPDSPANVVMEPFDRLEVMSRSTFADIASIKIDGAVRQPGKFDYGKNMSLRDALLLAGGMKLEAAYNRIDIYRVDIQENEPTRSIVARVQVDSSLSTAGSINLMPYDEIVVRSVPEFEFQRFVEIKGEVRYPGRYALISDNETLVDIVSRAGGLSLEAFAEGASLFRIEGQKGYIVTNLEDALHNKASKHNYILKEGDVINIPKREDLVTLRTVNTRASEILTATLIANGLINTAYTPHKRADWYIHTYAAGFGKNAKKTRVAVEQPNGKINHTSRFLFFKTYPKVTPGSIITVGSKPVKEKKEEKEKKPFDWDKAFSQILALTATMATVTIAIAALK